LTVICVFGSPAVMSRERNALTGVGVGTGMGEGDGDGGGGGDGDGEAAGDGESVGSGEGGGLGATSRNQSGRVARTRKRFMRSPEG
jgi:hypothetical protein